MSSDRLIIHKSGPLRGTVAVNGAKNAVLPIMAACLLTDDTSVIENVPRVTDVVTMTEILRQLGVAVEFTGSRLRITPGAFGGTAAPYELVSRMRASICVLGPLLARRGKAQVSLPGGCVIGQRPIDLHLKGLEGLGAAFAQAHGNVMGTAPKLTGSRVHLGGAFGSSVLATGNVMMAATLASGVTTIEQAACEPEVVDLADCLTGMGARIQGQGTPVIRVEGVPRLHGVTHRIIPDRIEAGTLMIAAALIGGELTVQGARSEHLGALIDKLSEATVTVEAFHDAVRVRSSDAPRAVDLTTQPFPGFPTDLQAQMMALMSVSRGVSVVTEKIYPERFMHIPELNRMGASITKQGASAIVKGVPKLSGAPVSGSDLRASAALLIAGLAAENRTELSGIEHLDRGYEHFETRLSDVGARIERVAA